MLHTENSISVRLVAKAYGAAKAIDGVSLDVKKGEFFSLLGPSGCGKSTLLRILAGFETPDVGDLYIDGRSMEGVPANRRPTNLVFQNYAIFPHLDVDQNIAYGLRRHSLSKNQIAEKVEQALVRMKLTGLGKRFSHQLSGGQRQRVALARALICEPKVLLLDEPLGALDKKLREEMQIELRQLQRSVGITFVFVTHDQEEALALSDRIAVMSEGKVIQIDTPSRIYERPGNRAVAEFIGTINLIDGHVKNIVDGLVVVSTAVGELRVKTDMVSSPGTRVSVAVRPEKVRIGPASDDAINILGGRLAARAYYGDRRHYHVEIPGLGRPFSVAAQSFTSEDDNAPDGQYLTLSWPPSGCLLLPAES